MASLIEEDCSSHHIPRRLPAHHEELSSLEAPTHRELTPIAFENPQPINRAGQTDGSDVLEQNIDLIRMVGRMGSPKQELSMAGGIRPPLESALITEQYPFHVEHILTSDVESSESLPGTGFQPGRPFLTGPIEPPVIERIYEMLAFVLVIYFGVYR